MTTRELPGNPTVAKIESTFLGIEDHGIMSVMLGVNYGGSGQGIGGHSLDEPHRDEDGKFVGRRGTAYGCEYIKRVMAACGVDSWEKVKGRTIYVLLRQPESESWGRGGENVIGIAPLPTESGEPFIFEDLIAEFRDEAAVSA